MTKKKALRPKPVDSRLERKKEFIRVLATMLGGTDQVKYSVALQLGGVAADMARQWVRLRSTTPLFGYPSVDEAEKTLTEFLLQPQARRRRCP